MRRSRSSARRCSIRSQQCTRTGLRARPVRNVATVIRMGKEDSPDEWTEVRTATVQFDVELPANLFTMSNLRNPRE